MNAEILSRAINLALREGHHATAQGMTDCVIGYPPIMAAAPVFARPRTLREIPPRTAAQQVAAYLNSRQPPAGYSAEELDRDNPFNAWYYEGGDR